jgi:hypothetical protein
MDRLTDFCSAVGLFHNGNTVGNRPAAKFLVRFTAFTI